MTITKYFEGFAERPVKLEEYCLQASQFQFIFSGVKLCSSETIVVAHIFLLSEKIYSSAPFLCEWIYRSSWPKFQGSVGDKISVFTLFFQIWTLDKGFRYKTAIFFPKERNKKLMLVSLIRAQQNPISRYSLYKEVLRKSLFQVSPQWDLVFPLGTVFLL